MHFQETFLLATLRAARLFSNTIGEVLITFDSFILVGQTKNMSS